MGDIGEALGTAAEGGLFARAFGGKSGALTDRAESPLEKGHFAEGTCLNCGTELVGAHCHSCGQKAHLHRTIGAFLHDLIHGALHLDGKIWRTLPMLVVRPGKLTRRYIDGERARFVSPMAIFLFSVFLMFAVFQVTGTSLTNVGVENPQRIWDVNAARADIVSNLTASQARRARLAKDLEVMAAQGAEPAQLAEIRAQIEEIDRLIASNMEGLKVFDALSTGDSEPISVAGADTSGKAVAAEAEGANADVTFAPTGIDILDQGIIRKWQENPSLMLYKLQANAYKFSWLLIPLSVPFVWLLFFWKRRFKAYDHAIFVTYSLAFVSLLFIGLSLLAIAGIGGGWVFAALAIIPPIHMYKHLKYTYGLSRFSTLWRLYILLVFEFVTLVLFLQLLLVLGAF
ncbi:MAG: hypothetical protein APF78_04865 [Sphingomonadales bacterium BRH_c3]|nr:MAG: hypothetical protein APF78_04865 [Sphingomonadales bacterium BRH_c3]